MVTPLTAGIGSIFLRGVRAGIEGDERGGGGQLAGLSTPFHATFKFQEAISFLNLRLPAVTPLPIFVFFTSPFQTI